MTFENTVIKKYWPAEDKNQDGDVLAQLHIQCEVELDNSLQVGYLFTSMLKGLMEAALTHEETGESLTLEAATIKPFNVKQKKLRIGKGEDATTVMAEFAQLKITTLLDDDGKLLQDLYPFFNRTLIMAVEDLPGPGGERIQAPVQNDAAVSDVDNLKEFVTPDPDEESEEEES